MQDQLLPLAERLTRARRVVLTTHASPDGDGLGSELALAKGLRKLGCKVRILNADPTPGRFRFLDAEGQIEVVPPETPIPDADMGLVLDTHAWGMLGSLADAFQNAPFPVAFLDHHPCKAPPPSREIFGTPEASSTGELVYFLLLAMGVAIDRDIAECLYVSLSYDTNSFKYIRSQARPLEIGAELIRCGVDTDRVYRHLFASNPSGKLKILGELLVKAGFVCGGKVSYVDIPNDFIRTAGVEQEALRDVVTHLLEVDGVEIAVVFKEPDPGEIKVSIRSKGRVAINGVAQDLGGGGHAFASGVEIAGTLKSVHDDVIDRLCRLVAVPETAAEQMRARG